MKNILLTVAFLLTLNITKAQDVIILKHTNYTSSFSKSKHYPIVVEWWETKAKVNCKNPLARKDNFKPDPLLVKETNIGSDYVNSGYDRGHLMPAKSNQCQTQAVQDECFYYSNIAAQTHRLNAGDWKSLEVLTREWASTQDSIHIWAGNVGEIKRIGRVAVPKQCWKVIHIKQTNKWHFFIFNNDESKPDGINNNEVLKKDIEKLTGIKFK